MDPLNTSAAIAIELLIDDIFRLPLNLQKNHFIILTQMIQMSIFYMSWIFFKAFPFLNQARSISYGLTLYSGPLLITVLLDLYKTSDKQEDRTSSVRDSISRYFLSRSFKSFMLLSSLEDSAGNFRMYLI